MSPGSLAFNGVMGYMAIAKILDEIDTEPPTTSANCAVACRSVWACCICSEVKIIVNVLSITVWICERDEL